MQKALEFSRAFRFTGWGTSDQLLRAPWSIQREIVLIVVSGRGVPPRGICDPGAVPRSLRMRRLPAPFPGMTAGPLFPPAMSA